LTGEGKQFEAIEDVSELVAVGPLMGLFALMDHDGSPNWPFGMLPPLGHWLYCLNRAPHAHLDLAGTLRNTPFLPQGLNESCFWRSGDVQFHNDVRLGGKLRRTSAIERRDEAVASGMSDLFQATHRYETAKGLAIEDRQEFICASNSNWFSANSFSAPGRAEWEHAVKPDPVMLIRYSALTFNSHRIHYDRGYCRQEAGFPGLVVQIPLVATLLADLFLRKRPGYRPIRFSYRVHSLLFDTHPILLKGIPEADGAILWAEGEGGRIGMSAAIKTGAVTPI
jgi:3-methylfumaryl-CoA hydratase